ncbi:hypothetical protein OB13_13155 [Pontibacter sp. HJ8]
MIENLPNWINLVFLLTVGITIVMFYFANGRKRSLLLGIIAWSVLQSILALQGFYQNTNTFPPRFAFVLVPIAIFIVLGLLPRYRNEVLKHRHLAASTFLHTVRVPVEIVLYLLFTYKMIPELMTFEGRNFDIAAGLTAPVIGLLILTKKANNTLLIAWNGIALCLVSFIMLNGILSAELPFQQFGFEQPNRAILYFPFILLPAVIVPIVIYTHLTDLILLVQQRKTGQQKLR